MLCVVSIIYLFCLYPAWGLFEAGVTLADNMAGTTFILDDYYSSHDTFLFSTLSFFLFPPFFPFMY
jgi:hypothetical protein